MKRALLLTGKPGTGKTALIKEALARTKVKGGGFYTEEIRTSGIRQGFKIVTLDGQEAIRCLDDEVDLLPTGGSPVEKLSSDREQGGECREMLKHVGLEERSELWRRLQVRGLTDAAQVASQPAVGGVELG